MIPEAVKYTIPSKERTPDVEAAAIAAPEITAHRVQADGTIASDEVTATADGTKDVSTTSVIPPAAAVPAVRFMWDIRSMPGSES